MLAGKAHRSRYDFVDRRAPLILPVGVESQLCSRFVRPKNLHSVETPMRLDPRWLLNYPSVVLQPFVDAQSLSNELARLVDGSPIFVDSYSRDTILKVLGVIKLRLD